MGPGVGGSEMPTRLHLRYVEEGELKESEVASGRLTSSLAGWQEAQLRQGLELASSTWGEKVGGQVRHLVSSPDYHVVAPNREIEQFTVTMNIEHGSLKGATVRRNDLGTEVTGEFATEQRRLPGHIDLSRYGLFGSPGLYLGPAVGSLDADTAEVVSSALEAIADGKAKLVSEGGPPYSFLASSADYREAAAIAEESEETAQFQVDLRENAEGRIEVRVTDRDEDSLFSASFEMGER
jgi:hypothetical protein